MSTAIRIPQVTEDDLLAFHNKTYGFAFTAVSTEPHYTEEEDDLGYYEDGAKRTLTDEQVEIFRHSEIHALLQEHGKKLAAEQEDAELSEGEIVSDIETREQNPSDVVATREEGRSDMSVDEDDDDEAEYARFLETERRDFEASAAAKRRLEHNIAMANDRSISTRRKVREMDEMATLDQALDYGDSEGVEAPSTSNTDLGQSKAEGRTIWWPTIGT